MDKILYSISKTAVAYLPLIFVTRVMGAGEERNTRLKGVFFAVPDTAGTLYQSFWRKQTHYTKNILCRKFAIFTDIRYNPNRAEKSRERMA